MSIGALLERFLFRPYARAQAFVTATMVPFLLGLVGLYYVVELFGALKSDTTAITNAAFVIMVSLAALAFGWARSLLQTDPRQWRIRFGGEQLVHSALQVLSASLLKYSALAGGASDRFLRSLSFAARIKSDGIPLALLDSAVSMLVVILFSSAVISAVYGVVSLGRAIHEQE